MEVAPRSEMGGEPTDPCVRTSIILVFAIALIAQSIAVYVEDFLRKRTLQLRQDERHDFDTVRATTMTLLALIIGFTF